MEKLTDQNPAEEDQHGATSNLPEAPPEDDASEPQLDDEKTGIAIDDIVANESDEVLAAEDQAIAAADAQKPQRGFWGGLGHFWATSKGRWITFLVLVAVVGSLFGVSVSRYWLLNSFGVRASLSATVVDNLTQTPLKHVKITLQGHASYTDSDGQVTLRNLRLGPAELVVVQTGFATVDQHVTVGWGSNPQGIIALKAVGVRYTLQVNDYLSGKSLADVEARSGDIVARSDARGKLVITLPSAAAAVDPVAVSKAGYRTDQIMLKDPAQTLPVSMVVAKKAVFVTKESGKYDVYKSDLDGQNKEVLLAATGSENSNSSLVLAPDNAHAAFVSTRDNQHGSDGFLLDSLSLINVADGSVVTLAHAEQIQLIDWIGNRLIFEQVSTDPSTPANSRYAIISYDVSAGVRAQLAAAAHINSVFSAHGVVYYAIGVGGEGAAHLAFYKVNPDGSGQQTVLDKEVASGQRTDYNTIALDSVDTWYSFDLVSNRATNIDEPASLANRLYNDNISAAQSLWVDTQGGQGVLMARDIVTGKDNSKATQNGLTYPVYWLADDIAMYRVITAAGASDYVLDLTAGMPHKIADVTNTYGFSQGQ